MTLGLTAKIVVAVWCVHGVVTAAQIQTMCLVRASALGSRACSYESALITCFNRKKQDQSLMYFGLRESPKMAITLFRICCISAHTTLYSYATLCSLPRITARCSAARNCCRSATLCSRGTGFGAKRCRSAI